MRIKFHINLFGTMERPAMEQRSGIAGPGYQPTVRTYAADRVWEAGKLLYSYFPGGYFDAHGAVHYLHNNSQGSVVLVTDLLDLLFPPILMASICTKKR